MDIFSLKEKYGNTSITNIPLRVAYYARVSTEKEEQLNALGNQLSYYEDYIKSCPNWTFVKGYVDEGLSGVSVEKRINFNRMLADADEGKFDLLITKEISRFARNTLDSIKYTRELLTKGVAVYFREDNINTLDTDSELRLTIMASLAQEESRRISNRIKVGHSMAIKKGRVLGNSRLYGYKLQGAKLSIIEEEAKMVRKIFELYASGEYSTNRIENILYEQGYRNRKGKRIDRSVIKNIISNPKYKGYYCGNKVKVVDMFTKQQKFLSEDEWEMWKDTTGETVPAIVSEELWESANRILGERGREVKLRSGKQQHNNLFTGIVQCSNEGCNYIVKYRTLHGKKVSPTWTCSHKLKYGAATCSSFSLKEDVLINIVKEVLKTISLEYGKVVENYISLKGEALKSMDFETDKNNLINQINKLNKKQDSLLELYSDGLISKEDFKFRNDDISTQLSKLKSELETIKEKEKKVTSDKVLDELKEIKNLISGWANNNSIDNMTINRKIIDTLIDRIIITPVNPDKYELEVGVVLKGDMSLKYRLTKENNKNFNLFFFDDMFNIIYSKRKIIETKCRCKEGYKLKITCSLKIYV